MTLEEAKNLPQGTTIYLATKRNADGTAMRAKVTSVKTWKRQPNAVRVRLKHGMYDYAEFTERELDCLCLQSPTAGTQNAKGKTLTE